MHSNVDLIIKDIEILEGIIYETNPEPDSGLSVWYSEIRNKRLSELTDGDIAKAIRQNLYLIYVVPEANRRLQVNPTIGLLYDGEVINALLGIKKGFWHNNILLNQEIKELLNLITTRQIIPTDFNWLSNEDEHEFYDNVEKLHKKLNDLKE